MVALAAINPGRNVSAWRYHNRRAACGQPAAAVLLAIEEMEWSTTPGRRTERLGNSDRHFSKVVGNKIRRAASFQG